MLLSSVNRVLSNKFGKAWFILSGILLLHIIDEAVNGFLPVYNENALRLRENTGIPMPVFTFPYWFTGLICLDVWLLFLSRYALQGRRIIIFLAYPFAIIMFLNGLMHLGGSVYLSEWLPGIITAPLLIYGSVNLLLATLKTRTTHPTTSEHVL